MHCLETLMWLCTCRDPEEDYVTYEEYLATKTRVKPVFENLRKPNEGTDTKQWKKAVALEKKKKGDHSDDEYEEYTDDEDTVMELAGINNWLIIYGFVELF